MRNDEVQLIVGRVQEMIDGCFIPDMSTKQEKTLDQAMDLADAGRWDEVQQQPYIGLLMHLKENYENGKYQ